MSQLIQRVRTQLATSNGPRLVYSPAPFHLSTDATIALDLAARLDRAADLHLFEGRGHVANRLAHAALELRCRVAGATA